LPLFPWRAWKRGRGLPGEREESNHQRSKRGLKKGCPQTLDTFALLGKTSSKGQKRRKVLEKKKESFGWIQGVKRKEKREGVPDIQDFIATGGGVGGGGDGEAVLLLEILKKKVQLARGGGTPGKSHTLFPDRGSAKKSLKKTATTFGPHERGREETAGRRKNQKRGVKKKGGGSMRPRKNYKKSEKDQKGGSPVSEEKY